MANDEWNKFRQGFGADIKDGGFSGKAKQAARNKLKKEEEDRQKKEAKEKGENYRRPY